MQLNVPSISLEIPRQLPPALRGWMLGQLLDATVIGRESGNSIRLSVAGTELRAATVLKLQVGDNLNLRVTQLKPVVTLTPVVASGTLEKTVLNASVNRILPMERPLAPTLEFVRDAVRPAAPGVGADVNRIMLPPAVTRAAEGVLASLPNLRDVIDATQLPRIIRQSGVFAENVVVTQFQTDGAPAVPTHDLKWQLLRLRGALQGEAPQQRATQNSLPSSAEAPRLGTALRSANPVTHFGTVAISIADTSLESQTDATQHFARLVDSAIARIETNQLKAVSALLDGDIQVRLDLPIVIDDEYHELRLMVQRDGPAPGVAEVESNSIVLEIPLTAEAIIRAVVTLRGDDLAVRLWSTNGELRGVLAGTRETLIERLRANGLDKVSVVVVELKPFDQSGRPFNQLVDTKA